MFPTLHKTGLLYFFLRESERRILHTELCVFLFFSSPKILHPQQTSSRSSDSLVRLYEMDDHPDRRVFLEKLLGFMEEKGTPITQCPTISKNPLDLFRLYLYTKERGGYLEVSALLWSFDHALGLKYNCPRAWCPILYSDRKKLYSRVIGQGHSGPEN